MSELKQAIIRTGGKQYRVSPGSVLRVEKLPHPQGATIEIDDVLLLGEGEAVRIGISRVPGAKVSAEVVEHGRGRKLVVYKFRRRANYRKKQGHRQDYTEIKITGIAG